MCTFSPQMVKEVGGFGSGLVWDLCLKINSDCFFPRVFFFVIDREKFGQCTHLKHNEQGFLMFC